MGGLEGGGAGGWEGEWVGGRVGFVCGWVGCERRPTCEVDNLVSSRRVRFRLGFVQTSLFLLRFRLDEFVLVDDCLGEYVSV